MVKAQFPYCRAAAFLLSVLCLLPAFAQEEFCNEPSKKALKLYRKAEALNFKGDETYFLLKECIAEDENFAEAFAMLGEINHDKYRFNLDRSGSDSKGSLNYEKRMVEYYGLAMERCPSMWNNRIAYILGEHYYYKKDRASARAYLNEYATARKSDAGNKLRDKALAWVEEIDAYFAIIQNPVLFDPEKLAFVSTGADEYLPSLTPDNRFLFFTRKEEAKKGMEVVNCTEEREVFCRSGNNWDGTFEAGQAMTFPFNAGKYQGGSCISVDNKLMFVTVVENVRIDGYGFPNGDIFYTEYRDGQWSELKSCGHNINSERIWEGQPSISADNKTLYFSRAIDKVVEGEHYGLMDIYKSERQADGSWGPAINLGPGINTAANEKSPFMHSDSYTLYFSSDRMAGVGGFDIFYSKMNGENRFEMSKNLGYPINTEDDEHGFIVSTDGKYGYFSSLMDEVSLDLYSFELYSEARPEQVVFVKGEALAASEALEGLEIKLRNVVTDKEVEAVIDRESGEYVGVIAVKENENVMMTAKKDGYAFTSQYISSDENVVGRPIKKDLELQEVKKGGVYRINDINFATNSYEVNPHIRSIIREFASYLVENSSLVVELRGHTDNVGGKEANLILSENRAMAVYNLLAEYGVEKNRLSYKGFGQGMPLTSNATEAGRALNRRTEFAIISE